MTENGESTATMPMNHDTNINQHIEMAAMTVRHSQTLGKLAGALALAQLEFKPIKKDSNNPYYGSKYADLANVIEATQASLAKNGLVVMQFPSVSLNAKSLTLTTMMTHTSNEWIASDLAVPATMVGKDKSIKFDVQSIGSAETYTRRYAYQAIVGVAAEADDDGNAAVTHNKIKEAEDAFDQRMEGDQYLAIFQMREIQRLQKQNGITDSQLLAFMKAKLGVERIEKVKKTDFETIRVYVSGQMPIQEALQTTLDGTGRTIVSKLEGEESACSVEGLLGSVAQKSKGDKVWLSIKMQDGFELSDWHIDHEQTLKPYVGNKVEFLVTAKGKGDKTYYNVDSLEIRA